MHVNNLNQTAIFDQYTVKFIILSELHDEKSLEKYITQIEKDLNTHNDMPFEEFNKIVGRAAEKALMSKYKRSLLKNNQRKSEAPWVNDEIRTEIKKRKENNRDKRNCNGVTKRELHNKLYINQKKLVQTKIREQMNIIKRKSHTTRPEPRKKDLG